MIHSHRFLLALFLSFALIAGCAASAPAQQSQPKTDDAETAALREKAFSLLESVASQLGNLQSPENRARLAANIADSLWKHDERRARELLQIVENDVRAELEKWDPESGENLRMMVFFKLRGDTVERIASHDAAAAIAFFKATKPSSNDLPKFAYHGVEGFEMRLAYKVAAENPEAAVILGREVLDQGFPFELIGLFHKLNRRHREQAQAFYKEIVDKLKDADFAEDWSARYMATNLVRAFRPPAVDESNFRELVSIFIKTAQSNGCKDKRTSEESRADFCSWLASEVPEINKLSASAAGSRNWRTDEIVEPNSGSPVLQELSDLLDEGTNDEVLAFASRHPEIAQQTYFYLIDRAFQAGDFEEARKIAAHISDPERRQNLLAQLDKSQKKVAIDDGAMARIDEILKTIRKPSAQAWFLLTRAHLYGAADRKVALKLLDRAGDIIDTMKPDKERAAAELGLATFHCFEKSERGMALMESLVPRLNELVEFAVRLDGYDTNYLRDGEWNMSASGGVGELLTRLSGNAGFFAWYDFDRAVSLASQFQRPEIRMMAQVKLAQSILAGPPKRQPVFSDYGEGIVQP